MPGLAGRLQGLQRFLNQRSQRICVAGNVWWIATHKVSPDELKKRAEALMKQQAQR
jgi:hypothetical protein